MAFYTTHFISINLGQTNKILCRYCPRELQLHVKHDFSLNLLKIFCSGDVLKYVSDNFFSLVWGDILIRIFY
jgi:hypothetical protein